MSKRIIVPSKSNQTLVEVPAVENLVAEALSVIQTEIVRFSSKTKQGRSLDLKEARVLQGYIKALVELSKETRERMRDQDFSNMTDKELADLLGGLLEKRKTDANSGSSSS